VSRVGARAKFLEKNFGKNLPEIFVPPAGVLGAK
jgi:hypothetical protein